MNIQKEVHHLTLHMAHKVSPQRMMAFRADIIEHAAITFLRALRLRFVHLFKDIQAAEIIDVLFKRKGRTRNRSKVERIRLIIDLLYDVYPDFEYFHNHMPHSDYNNHDYPLIHYRVQGGKAKIVALAAAIPIVKEWLRLADPRSWMSAANMQCQEGSSMILVHDRPLSYRLLDWCALSDDNYKKWKVAPLMRERLEILEKSLTGHLRMLSSTFLPQQEVDNIHGEIILLKNIRTERTFGHTDLVFNILYRTHLSIPEPLSLGRVVSLGYGTQKRTRWQRQDDKIRSMIQSELETVDA